MAKYKDAEFMLDLEKYIITCFEEDPRKFSSEISCSIGSENIDKFTFFKRLIERNPNLLSLLNEHDYSIMVEILQLLDINVLFDFYAVDGIFKVASKFRRDNDIIIRTYFHELCEEHGQLNVNKTTDIFTIIRNICYFYYLCSEKYRNNYVEYILRIYFPMFEKNIIPDLNNRLWSSLQSRIDSISFDDFIKMPIVQILNNFLQENNATN